MKLNRTPNPLDRNARNGENDNWDIIEGNIKRIDDTVSDLVIESGGDSNLEVVQARGGKRVLNDRLNEIEGDVFEKADKAALAQVARSKRDKDVEIEMKDLSQEVKEAMTGDSVAVVGDDAVGTNNLKDNAVNRDKLNKNFMLNLPWLTGEENDLNYVWDEGNYMIGSTVSNNPYKLVGYLTVNRFRNSSINENINVKQTMTYVDGVYVFSIYRMIRAIEDDADITWITDWKEDNVLDGFLTAENEDWVI